MARKTLLTEGEIRRFLKLANVGPVGETKLSEMYGDSSEQIDEEDEMTAMDLDPEGDVEGGEEEEVEMDMEPMEMGDEEDLGAEGGEERMVSVDDFMGALEDALEDALGEPVAVDMDQEEEGDLDVEDDLGAPEDEAAPEDVEVAADEEEMDVMAEITRRVAARLVKEKQNGDIADQLAERIMKRLTK